MSVSPEHQRILRRAEREIVPGQVVNLGIGLPTGLFHYLPARGGVLLHSENGILGSQLLIDAGPPDLEMIDAGGTPISVMPGASVFDSAMSFALIRRGRVDLSFMGAFEVDSAGNLANWRIPGRFSPGIGGAMELAQKARRLVILCTHTDKRNAPKIVERCQLPLTAPRCVSRIITELAVMDVTSAGLRVAEIAEGTDIATLREQTGCELHIDPDHLGTF